MDRAAATEEVIETLEESPRVVDYEKEEENIPEDGGIEVQKSSSEESMAASVPEEAINTETYTTDGDDIKRNSTDNAVNVFYKKGQNLDSCLVANYARRVR